MLDVVNAFYSSEVVDRVQSHGVVGHPRLRGPKGAIPLPATFTIDLGRRISERSKTGMQVRLYSDYPFRSRQDGGPEDEFERDALAELTARPGRAGLPVRGVPRAARRCATRPPGGCRQTCVSCHNTHPNSTKRDWKEGEVGGVLEIIRPLDGDVQRRGPACGGRPILMAVTFGSLLGASGADPGGDESPAGELHAGGRGRVD